MKTFTLLFSLLVISLGFSPVAIGSAALTEDCGCKDSDNSLKNGGFESGTDNWTFTGDGSFGTDTKYSICGSSKNGLISGPGTVFQEVSIAGGSKVNFTVYGGTHDTDFRHRIFLTFYDGNTLIRVTENDHNMVSMNYKVTREHKLQQYSLWENAPANANKVRVSFSSNGNYFKIDAACMSVDPPAPVAECCKDEDNAIKNGSFEEGTRYWEKGTTTFGTDQAYNMCGYKNGLITGSGSVYQDVSIGGGSKISVTAYGGTHDTRIEHSFRMEFYNGDTKIASITPVPMDYKVTDSKLKKFTIYGEAPSNATKVRFIIYSAGDYFKVDVVCMTIIPSQCETCINNRLANADFETGTGSWTSEGDVNSSPDAKNCGEKGIKLTGQGRFYQDINFISTWGSLISLTIWGAKDDNGGQKFQIFFYDSSNKELGKIEKDVSKIFDAAPGGLEKYMLAGAIPSGTKVIRIQGSASSGVFRADQGCLTFTGSPLPVTLAAFDVKREGSTALLNWATTYETNSDHFDIQHSQDGKTWNVLTTIASQGESRGLITYHYTHTNPFAVNLYRLKMVDADGTFAYSSIRNLNFNADLDMAIYPNPTSDRIRFSGKQNVDNVKVYNTSGIMVLNTLPNASNEVDLTKLSQGIYFVKVNNSPVMRKVVVVK